MDRIIVAVVGGSSVGGIFALVALGMVLSYRATHTFSFAHGQLMLLPAFMVGAWTSGSHTMSLGVAIVVAILVTAVIAGAFYLLVLQRTTGLPLFMGVIATFGLAYMIDAGMLLFFPEEQYAIKLPVADSVSSVFGARIGTSSLQVTVFTLSLAGLLMLVLRFTSIGRQVHAAGQDPILASHGGINVRLFHLLSWAIAGVLAAVAGIAYGTTHLVDRNLVGLMLAAFPAILIGGLDSIGGAIVGGLLVGIFQGFVVTYFSADAVDMATYSAVLVVMLFLPQGLWATKSVVRV